MRACVRVCVCVCVRMTGEGESGGTYLTLRRLSVWLSEPLRRMRVLALVADATAGKEGGELAGAVHTLAQVSAVHTCTQQRTVVAGAHKCRNSGVFMCLHVCCLVCSTEIPLLRAS